MLHARRHPCANIGPVALDLHYGVQGQPPVVFNGLSLLFVAGGDAERRVPVALAERNDNVVQGVLVVRRLNDEHGSFEVFCQIGRVVAVVVLIIVFLQALRKRIPSSFVLDQRKQVLRHDFDGFHLGKGGEVLADEEATIRHGVDLGLFCVLEEVVGVQVSGDSARRHSSDDDRVSVVEVELLVEIAELLHHVVVSSEVELLVLIRNGILSAA